MPWLDRSALGDQLAPDGVSYVLAAIDDLPDLGERAAARHATPDL